MAPRFLASAFAGGPAMLILLALLIKKVANWDAGREAIEKLTTIVTYAAIVNAFFLGLEFFTAYYSNVPGHEHTLTYLFVGLEGHNKLVPFMWTSVALQGLAIVLLLSPLVRKRMGVLAVACTALFFGLWLDKGIGLVLGGFVPNPLDEITEYAATGPEIAITIGVWAMGFAILTALYRIAITIKQERDIV
jgi:molybdopterin-containing oxidoreductase family membrane subunit